MTITEGYYYLHTNGDLIFKRFCPEDDSPFVKKVWRIDTNNRATAWTVILEALVYEANLDRIKELAYKWGCSPADLPFLFLQVKNPTETLKRGVTLYLEKVCGMDETQRSQWWNWLKSQQGSNLDYSTMPWGMWKQLPDGQTNRKA